MKNQSYLVLHRNKNVPVDPKDFANFFGPKVSFLLGFFYMEFQNSQKSIKIMLQK